MNRGRKGSWGFIAGTAMLALALTGCAKREPAAPEAVWNTSLDAALADAKTHHRPIILDFYADW
jgi:thiol:disulfide interchange protein